MVQGTESAGPILKRVELVLFKFILLNLFLQSMAPVPLELVFVNRVK